VSKGRISISLVEYEEGSVRFYATDLRELESRGLAYTKAEVFYNPYMRSNRDIAVAVASTLGEGFSAADVMAASGVRVLRLASEAGGGRLIANDKNPLAVYAIRKGVRANELSDRVRVWMMDANEASLKIRDFGRVDYLDVDPFGSPAPYVWAAVQAVKRGGVLAVTATDTPVLYGVYPAKLYRAYLAWGEKTEFHKEMGLRLLAAFVLRVAAMYDLVATPVLSHATRHYARVYFSIDRGALRALRALEEGVGWILYCQRCGWRETESGRQPPGEETCPLCSHNVSLIGPAWLGELQSKDLLSRAVSWAERRRHWISEEAMSILRALASEVGLPPLYYDLDAMASRMKLPSVSPRVVVEELESRGFRASLSHCEKKAVKTDAKLEDVMDVLRDLARGRE